MIIVQITPEELYLCEQAMLKLPNGTDVQPFGTSEALIEYLKLCPDIPFLLQDMSRPSATAEPLEGDVNDYPVEDGHVYTGQVRYDAEDDTVVCG